MFEIRLCRGWIEKGKLSFWVEKISVDEQKVYGFKEY